MQSLFLLTILATFTHAFQVPVDLYVMSTCPDAGLCARLFEPIYDELHSIINVHLDYVVDQSTQPPKCKRGPGDCEGNRQQLCFRQYHQDPSKWFKLFTCMSTKQRDIPSIQLYKDCALQVGGTVTSDELECVNGVAGAKLLDVSGRRTWDLGVRKSCTIYLNKQKRCVHDGVWKECTQPGEQPTSKTFVKDICDIYEKETGQVAEVCKRALSKDDKWSELDSVLDELEDDMEDDMEDV